MINGKIPFNSVLYMENQFMIFHQFSDFQSFLMQNKDKEMAFELFNKKSGPTEERTASQNNKVQPFQLLTCRLIHHLSEWFY